MHASSALLVLVAASSVSAAPVATKPKPKPVTGNSGSGVSGILPKVESVLGAANTALPLLCALGVGSCGAPATATAVTPSATASVAVNSTTDGTTDSTTMYVMIHGISPSLLCV